MPPRRTAKKNQTSSQDSPLPVPSSGSSENSQDSPLKRKMEYNQAQHSPLLAFYLSTIFKKSEEKGGNRITKKKLSEFFESKQNVEDFIEFCKLGAEIKYENIIAKKNAIIEKLSEKGGDLNDLIKKAYFMEMELKFESSKKRTNSEINSSEIPPPPAAAAEENEDDVDTDTDDTAPTTTNSNPKRKKT